MAENQNNENNQDNLNEKIDEFEDICYICRRPESVAGKMIHIQDSICICNDCMQKTFDTMAGSGFNMGNMMNMDLSRMPNISMINLSDLAGQIPERQKIKKKKPKEKKAVRLPIIVFLAFLLCLTVGQVNLSKYTDTLVIDRGYSTATLGHYVFITGLLGFFANLFLIPVLKKAKNLRHERLLLLFVFVSAILILITYNVPGDLLVMLYTSNLAYAMIKTMITPLEQAHLAKNTNDSNRGTVMGLRQSVISIGNVIGPLVGSAVYVTGSATIMNVSAGFLGVGFLILILDLFLERKAQKI